MWQGTGSINRHVDHVLQYKPSNASGSFFFAWFRWVQWGKRESDSSDLLSSFLFSFSIFSCPVPPPPHRPYAGIFFLVFVLGFSVKRQQLNLLRVVLSVQQKNNSSSYLRVVLSVQHESVLVHSWISTSTVVSFEAFPFRSSCITFFRTLSFVLFCFILFVLFCFVLFCFVLFFFFLRSGFWLCSRTRYASGSPALPWWIATVWFPLFYSLWPHNNIYLCKVKNQHLSGLWVSWWWCRWVERTVYCEGNTHIHLNNWHDMKYDWQLHFKMM